MEPGTNKSDQEKSEEVEEEGEISQHFLSSRFFFSPPAILSHSPLPERLEQAYIPVYDD